MSSVDEFRRLVALVQIENVRLVEGHCQTRIQPEDFTPSEFGATHGSKVLRPIDQTGSFSVLARLTAEVTPKGVAGSPVNEAPLMRFLAIYELKYRVPSGEMFDEDSLRQFARTNALLNVWPYWREFVQTCTLRMGMPGFVLPVLRMGELLRQQTAPRELQTGPAAGDDTPAKPETARTPRPRDEPKRKATEAQKRKPSDRLGRSRGR